MWISPARSVEEMWKTKNQARKWGIFLIRQRQSCRWGKFSPGFLWSNEPSGRRLSNPTCGENQIFPLLHRGVDKFSTTKRGSPLSKTGEISGKTGNFGEMYKLCKFDLCKNASFPHGFPQPVEKMGDFQGGMWEIGGYAYGKIQVFHRRGERAPVSFP